MNIELPAMLTAQWNWLASTEEESFISVYFGHEEIVTLPAVHEVEPYSYDADKQRQDIINKTVARWLREKLS